MSITDQITRKAISLNIVPSDINIVRNEYKDYGYNGYRVDTVNRHEETKINILREYVLRLNLELELCTKSD